MKKFLLIAMIALACAMAKAQVVIPSQDIHYNVNYHWGLIDVMIARGVVHVESDGSSFYGTLDGTSIPWEGRVILVSDTLGASMQRYGDTFRETVNYQSGWYRRPRAADFGSARYNPDDPAYYKNIAGQGAYDASHDSMEAITVTSDMIGMYYYAHAIDFAALEPGSQVRVEISGGYARELLITYNGKGTYAACGSTYPTYDCTFEYSYAGTMSGYPVECHIGVTDRIPMLLSASLPVGKVEMLYDPE